MTTESRAIRQRTRRPQAMSDANLPGSEYKYGFHDEDVTVYNTGKGLTEQT